ncbi:MAG: class I SAM-dependent methyltransferase [Terriglobales bacterium]
MPMKDGVQRFSSRVENYVRYRPGYPKQVLGLLQSECGLAKDSIVAEIAFGTGIFTRLLLENGHRVVGVEPNRDMRAAGEEFLSHYSGFTSVEGTAEATTLADSSVNLVIAAQAGHWFDPVEARPEFMRILKPGGYTVLLWNDRRADSTEFQCEYEQLLRTYGTDYEEVRQRGMTLAILGIFANSPLKTREFEYKQTFDYAGLEGRLLSSSYAPQEGHPSYVPMLRELRRIFEKYQAAGQVSFEYDTRVHYGQLA